MLPALAMQPSPCGYELSLYTISSLIMQCQCHCPDTVPPSVWQSPNLHTDNCMPSRSRNLDTILIYPAGQWADPSGTAMLGLPMMRTEQAPDPYPLSKISLISRWPTLLLYGNTIEPPSGIIYNLGNPSTWCMEYKIATLSFITIDSVAQR